LVESVLFLLFFLLTFGRASDVIALQLIVNPISNPNIEPGALRAFNLFGTAIENGCLAM
jgi:hypothetical protein